MAGGEPLVLRPPGIWGNAAPGLCRAGLSGSETFPSGAVRDALSQGDVCEKIRLVTSTSAGPISKDRSRDHDPLLPCPASLAGHLAGRGRAHAEGAGAGRVHADRLFGYDIGPALLDRKSTRLNSSH